MSPRTSKLTLILLVLLSCTPSNYDDGKTFNETYKVGRIPDLRAFETYDEIERSMDSINSDYDAVMDSLIKANNINKTFGLAGKRDFRNNRSRIFLESYTNNKLDSGDFSKRESLPMPCTCTISGDTVYVNMGIGFFGGTGFDIILFKNQFSSNYFVYTDDVKPFKSNLSDTSFTDFAVAHSKYQALILNQKPTFQPSQQLTGFLTFTTNKYYTHRWGNNLDTTHVTGKLYFTCNTKKK